MRNRIKNIAAVIRSSSAPRASSTTVSDILGVASDVISNLFGGSDFGQGLLNGLREGLRAFEKAASQNALIRIIKNAILRHLPMDYLKALGKTDFANALENVVTDYVQSLFTKHLSPEKLWNATVVFGEQTLKYALASSKRSGILPDLRAGVSAAIKYAKGTATYNLKSAILGEAFESLNKQVFGTDSQGNSLAPKKYNYYSVSSWKKRRRKSRVKKTNLWNRT